MDTMIYDALPEQRKKLGSGAQFEHFNLAKRVSLGLSAVANLLLSMARSLLFVDAYFIPRTLLLWYVPRYIL